MSKADIIEAQCLLGTTQDGIFGANDLAALKRILNVPVVSVAVDADLIADLKRDEGLRLNAYPDPLSGGAPWTIGYGATGPGIVKGTVWTQDQAEKRLVEMALQHGMELETKAPWVAGLDQVRRNVLWNMAYNLGAEGLLAFRNTLAYVKKNQWDKAADGMAASLWARQVGARAVRLAKEMRTGVRAR